MGDIAKEKGYTQSQLALAWAIANKDVSTLILGFSKIDYIEENMRALEIYRAWDAELEAKVEGLLDNTPAVIINYRLRTPAKSRRSVAVLEKKLPQ